MSTDKFVITIDREYGAGGKAVGKALAEELGIDFYDEDILRLTAETSAIGEQYFRLNDEKSGNKLLYKIFDSLKPSLKDPEVGDKITDPDNLFRFQAKLIRELAAKENCIIVGRAGNYILKEAGTENLIRFFVYSEMSKKIERIVDLEKTDSATAEKHILKIDKQRDDYYKYYTGASWRDPAQYDLCIDSTNLTYPQIALIIKDFMHIKGYEF